MKYRIRKETDSISGQVTYSVEYKKNWWTPWMYLSGSSTHDPTEARAIASKLHQKPPVIREYIEYP